MGDTKRGEAIFLGVIFTREVPVTYHGIAFDTFNIVIPLTFLKMHSIT